MSEHMNRILDKYYPILISYTSDKVHYVFQLISAVYHHSKILNRFLVTEISVIKISEVRVSQYFQAILSYVYLSLHFMMTLNDYSFVQDT